MTTIFKIAEKCQARLGGGDLQVLISECIDALGVVVKKQWFEGRNDGVSEIGGEYIYTYGRKTPLTPTLDCDIETYYITIPSSYLGLPYSQGIYSVSDGKGKEYVMVDSAIAASLKTIKAYSFGGRELYYVEGANMY
jgi:hypothetical protein